MINCHRENSQASGPMTNRAGCKHIYLPASDLLRMDGILSVVYKLYGLVYIDVNINNMIFVGTYCLFVSALVVSFAPSRKTKLA
jgi:hypothetical protein